MRTFNIEDLPSNKQLIFKLKDQKAQSVTIFGQGKASQNFKIYMHILLLLSYDLSIDQMKWAFSAQYKQTGDGVKQ